MRRRRALVSACRVLSAGVVLPWNMAVAWPSDAAATGIRAGSKRTATSTGELIAEQGDVTLVEVQARLIERGAMVGIGTVHRFFVRHGIARKTYGPPRLQGGF